MTTRIEPGGPGTFVSSGDTAARTTPAPARPFRNLVNSGTQAVIDGAEAAVRRLPGGPMLAAAIRPAPGHVPAGARPEGPTGTAAPDGGVASGGDPSTSAAGGAGEATSVEDTLARSADQNLYYLELQERISAESRSYSALSNVLKARHDTIKNAIGNIR